MTEETRQPSGRENIEARDVLESARIAYLSMADGGPYVIPICFAYESPEGSEGWGRIVFHTGEGRKTRALAIDPRVCLAVVVDAAFDQGPAPCADAFAYRSVLVEGSAVRLENRAEREQALRLIVGKYDPHAGICPLPRRTSR